MRILILGGCGYVGSALYRYLVCREHQVDTVDSEERGNHANLLNNKKMRYQMVFPHELKDYDAVICVAGRSSVASAVANPYLTVSDNLSGLVDLATEMPVDGPRFLFASSASVLSPLENGHNNIYDATKRASEQIVPLVYPNTYVLRFGTVCGAAPNLRLDLVINRMVRDALVDGVVRCANPDSWRPILGVRDLCTAVARLAGGSNTPGIYNLASFNTTFGDLAEDVAALLGVPVEFLPATSAYDFVMGPSDIGGWEPIETVETIVEGLRRQHKDTPLGEWH